MKKNYSPFSVTFQVKSPDEFGAAIQAMGLTETEAEKFFKYGEYATFELDLLLWTAERPEHDGIGIGISVEGRILPVHK